MGNLSLDQVATNQNNKETTINDADAEIENALTDKTSKSMTSLVSPITLTTLEYLRCIRLDFTGALTGNFTVHFPAVKKMTIVSNSTTGGHKITVDIASGTGIDLQPGDKKIVYADGTNVNLVADLGIKIGAFQSGLIVNAGFFLRFLAPFNYTMKVALPGAQVSFSANPTSSSKTFTLNKNGSSIGTIAISSAGAVTTTFTADVSFTAGTDVLDIATPSQDATLADLAIILPAIRTS